MSIAYFRVVALPMSFKFILSTSTDGMVGVDMFSGSIIQIVIKSSWAGRDEMQYKTKLSVITLKTLVIMVADIK